MTTSIWLALTAFQQMSRKAGELTQTVFSLTLPFAPPSRKKYGLACETRVGHGTFRIVMYQLLNCYKHTCMNTSLCSFGSQCISYQKMQLHRRQSAKRCEKKLKNEPSSVTASWDTVVDFTETRATELQCLLKAVTGKEMGKRTFQKLSRHMRWRAMSHNVRQLPRRLREN